MPNSVKFALPKGRLLPATIALLNRLGLGIEDYSQETRKYCLKSKNFPQLSARVFHEKDIPIEVAIGSYDLGICGLDWIEELLARYKASALTKISGLGYGGGHIYVVAGAGTTDIDKLRTGSNCWRIVTEYPNLAEEIASKLRLRDFKIFPVWGAAEVYPPEDADLAVLCAASEEEMVLQGLVPLMQLLSADAFLIANRESLENKDLTPILACFPPGFTKAKEQGQKKLAMLTTTAHQQWERKEIKLALPDGHQQIPTSQFLTNIGVEVSGYSEGNRRPSTNISWLSIKVIRPQDMPLQVANGNFDLAITGEDWLTEHLYRFPLSPVEKLLTLGFGKVKIAAAISQSLAVKNVTELKEIVRSGQLSRLRVASEYINIADRYLWEKRISPYKLVPIYGASEAFLPEDADLLIDNTQTGRTLAQHNLKVIDVLFESTACLVGNKYSISHKKEKIDFLLQIFAGGKKL